ncbi:hypothetical protein [Williamsia sterculiae]|uniref:Uncharacterized protein n=1 Tax=Williamsia sterculiae TaxID=1344003 RepID=A0A1N7HE61_9NOCA|nr:hypothetical protein [Williamsia sterculiae]SIS23167.1 hypothetical protein SAMN05445060_4069 [Williamsia sterculiae]
MSSPAIDFASIESQVRAEADRKVEVLRAIVDTHTQLTAARDAFFADDARRVAELSALTKEASDLGLDTKHIKPFEVSRLSPSRGESRRRASRPRKPSSPAPRVTDAVSADRTGEAQS